MTAILAIVTGLAYTTLGALVALELIRHRRERGFSHFGVALVLMTLFCGPHFLFMRKESAPLLAALALGVAPAVIVFALRLEVAFGGAGDRLVRASRTIAALPWVMTAAGGATLFAALREAATHGVDPSALFPNVILFAALALVGHYIACVQLARRPLLDGWSLSGAAMSATFFTSGLTHLVAGLLHPGSAILAALAVPATFYFLWAVHRLHRDSARDWNRRPLVGHPAPQGRRSPWAEQGA